MRTTISKITREIILILFFLYTGCFSIYSQKKVILNDFKSDFIFYDGLLAVENLETKKWGFVDTTGNIVIPFEWDRTSDIWLGLKSPKFGGGACALYKMVAGNKRWYIVNKKGGQTPLPTTTITVSNFNEDGIAVAIKRTGDKYKNKRVYINANGVEIFPTLTSIEPGKDLKFDSPPAFHDGLALFGSYGKYGYFDRQGRIVVAPKLVQAKDFSDGLAAVMTPSTSTSPSRWGYINNQGIFTISPQFKNEVDDFHEGFAVVKKTNGTLVFINKTGTAVTKELSNATRFFNGYAWIVFDEDNRFNDGVIVDRDFNITKKAPAFYRNDITNDSGTSIRQYLGKYILLHETSDDKLVDAAGNEAGFWCSRICSENIAMRWEDRSCKFIDIAKKQYIFSIDKSEF